MFGDKEVAEFRLLYFLRFQKIPPSRYLLGQPGWRVVVVYRLLVLSALYCIFISVLLTIALRNLSNIKFKHPTLLAF